jgi:hypothetical protein
MAANTEGGIGMKQAILLLTNGSVLEVKRPDNRDIDLHDVQGMVEGYFEVWPVLVMWHGKLCQMLVDEEGKLKTKHLMGLRNQTATELTGGEPVYGPAVVCYYGKFD